MLIPEIGNFALILALCLALFQAMIPLVGSIRNNVMWMRTARPFALGQCFFVLISYLALTYSFVVNDFSVAYVAQNSSSELPVWYRWCALWGAHEGSMLLWVTILSLWTVAVVTFSRSLPRETLARVLAVLGMISVGFLLFLLMTSNPFLRFLPNMPLEGRDLNPLLQDPGFVFHPPMLYMGYVGFSVAFAFAIASLIAGRVDAAWAKWSRPWTLVAWSFLTTGITLGSWWAYRELGWGGWWFWDPVENASFLPWLIGTALVHALIVVEKRNAFKAWTVLLAITAFSLSLLGTFIVRSGVLTSVHAFATDPKRGVFMLGFLVVVIGVSLLIYAWRSSKVKSVVSFGLLSREALLLTNTVLLMVAMVTVLLGTLYPLIIEALGLGKLSVGPPYFNTIFVPMAAVIFLFMGVGPQCAWQQTQPRVLLKKLSYVFCVSLSLALLLPWVMTGSLKGHVILGLTLAFWIGFTTVQDVLQRAWPQGGLLGVTKLSRAQYGMVVAHLGVAVCAVGIALSTAYSVEREVRLAPGDAVSVGPYQFKFLGTKILQGANYQSVEGAFRVFQNQRVVTDLHAEKRFYRIAQQTMTDAAVDGGMFRDLYVALGESLDGDAWSVRFYYKPFIRWIWGGGLFMLLGGFLAASDRRYRAERRQAQKAPLSKAKEDFYVAH